MKVKSVRTDEEIDIEVVLNLLDGLGEDDLRSALDGLPLPILEQVLKFTDPMAETLRLAPESPLLQAQEIDERYRARAHLVYLSDRLSRAIKDVESGKNRHMIVSMPPRMGKSFLSSVFFPVWVLRKHPDWKLGLISHSPSLAVEWGREIRSVIRDNLDTLGVSLARDAGAVTEWKTTAKGSVLSRSVAESVTGRGFKVLIVDDAIKDHVDAHSHTKRDALWNWWLSTAKTRLEDPYLVIFIGTRWHEDDIIGRLLSAEYPGDPAVWEKIEFPAIAEKDDVLGRTPGQPLYSPLLEESETDALDRWKTVKEESGTYVWSALYQQAPSPSKGSVFDVDWWRFWTTNPANVTDDDRVVLLDPDEDLKTARWLDSWDCAFKATESSDYVVGQRWAHTGSSRYLVHQVRTRMTFTATVTKMEGWLGDAAPYSRFVHERLVEDKANGTAIIDTLKEKISGMVAVNPTTSKEARARAITPECEAGNVVLPYPRDPGNEWVQELLSELREFPNGAHDDQVDALTQALSRLRTPRGGTVFVPGNVSSLEKRRGQVALEQMQVRRAGGR